MLPVKSNTAEQGCIPVSSNCVVWQGPDIPCLNLCNGDTVSDVVYKVATDLCTIKSTLDLTNLDLACLVTFCSSANPAPTTKTLSAVLDFIVRKICCLEDLIPAAGGTPYTEPTLPLPTCLQYVDGGTGLTVTQLIHNQYTLRIANQYCSLKATVDSHATTLTSHNARITALENITAPSLPTVTPNCILPSTPTAMSVVLDKLEEEYCLLRTALGSNSQITAAASQQCIALSSANALSQASTMSSISGWNTTVTNMSQAMQNLWITVCDMRAVIADLKNCCGQSDCSGFILEYTASANANRQEVYLDFNPTTVIPSGFIQALQNTTITISDGTNSKTYTINIVTEAANSTPYTCIVAGGSVVGTPLNTSMPYTVTVNAFISKNSNVCNKSIVKNISVPCPIVTGVTATLV
jgi:hypothetical protein